MLGLGRIHCHYCGARSAHSKTSGIPNFTCASCEAVNFLDNKGNIIDTPFDMPAQSQQFTREQSPPFSSFTQQLQQTSNQRQDPAFCNTCELNQRLYMENLANYLPDDDDPSYQEYEDALPQFKEGLERRYPQVCEKCAPLAQGKIRRADYYAGTANINKRADETARRGFRGSRRPRDDWWKWSKRRMLGMLEAIVYFSLLLQAAWHVYGILVARTSIGKIETEDAGLAFDPTPRECLQDASRFHFNDICYGVIGAYIPRALMVSGALIWSNTKLKDYYHHTHRYESIAGQKEHFYIQLLLLAARFTAWSQLSSATAMNELNRQQLIAAHLFTIVFMVLAQWLSNRTVQSVRFKFRQKMTPAPHERDVLGMYAGPAREDYDRHASSIPPNQLFAKGQLDRMKPFPIANLAPGTGSTRNRLQGQMPSPPLSDETDDDGDPMDIDNSPAPLQSTMPGAKIDRIHRPKVAHKRLAPPEPRSIFNHSNTQGAGWSGMRDSLFGIRDDMEVENERKRKAEEGRAKLKYQPPVDPSPFRGRLPQAPMSLGRRLRNPVTQLSFKEVPVSKQENFMQQMREGITHGKMFGSGGSSGMAQGKKRRSNGMGGLSLGDEEDESDFSPVEGTDIELKPSKWTLPGDLAQATGLEDLFGGNTFRIDDRPPIPGSFEEKRREEKKKKAINTAMVAAVPVAVVAIGWNITPIRKAVCLWLVARMEDLDM